ncbi:hypothetical protein HDV05_000911 [Chytridiales sp. JEL 0842]|nr:hypothetical protein HDV05_000911 [Chytridiales sp. JEL 0842]
MEPELKPETTNIKSESPPQLPSIPGLKVLEWGHIFFFFRPKVERHEAHGLDDVQRFFMLLKPLKGGDMRLLWVGRKRMPNLASHERLWGCVDAAGGEDRIKEALKERVYQTRTLGEFFYITARRNAAYNVLKLTKGERHVESVRPCGEGVYCIASKHNATHLDYVLETPDHPGEVQKDFKSGKEGSYIIAVKNPTKPSPSWAGIHDPSQKAQFPKDLMDRFHDRAFLPVDPPRFLDFWHCEIELIGAHDNVTEDLGDVGARLEQWEIQERKELRAQHNDLIFTELHLAKDKFKLQPLAGRWALGTRGDIDPVFFLALSLSKMRPLWKLKLITHDDVAQQFESSLESDSSLQVIGVGTRSAGVHASYSANLDDAEDESIAEPEDNGNHHAHEQQKKMESENILNIILNNGHIDAIVFTRFALQGYSIAEHLKVPSLCISSFLATDFPIPNDMESQMEQVYPELVSALRANITSIDSNQFEKSAISMIEFRHWMWRLFLDDVGLFRERLLALSAVPMVAFEDEDSDRLVAEIPPRPVKLVYTIDPIFAESIPLHISPNIIFAGYIHLPIQRPHAVATSSNCAKVERFIHISFGSMDYFHPSLRSPFTANLMLQCAHKALQELEISAVWTVSHSNTTLYQTWKANPRFSDKIMLESNREDVDYVERNCIGTIHHGGSGTVHRCLRYGKPMVIRPFMFDQEIWAGRVERMGVGKRMEGGGLSVEGWVGALRWLLCEQDAERESVLAGYQKRMAVDGLVVALKHAIDLSSFPPRESQYVVLEPGSHTLKAGWADYQVPMKVKLPSLVGIRVNPDLMSTDDAGGEATNVEYLTGHALTDEVSKALEESDKHLSIVQPIKSGKVVDWDAFEVLIKHTLVRELEIRRSKNDAAVLVCLPLTWSQADIERLVQLLFEKMNVPGLYIAEKPLMALFGCGVLSGLVIDVGHETMELCEDIAAVVDCQVTRHTAQSIPLGGKNVEHYLHKLLQQDSTFMSQWGPQTPIDPEFVKALKESNVCEVKLFREHATPEALKSAGRAEFVYKGKTYSIGTSRFLAFELLFNPSLDGLDVMGIAEAASLVVMSGHDSPEKRFQLWDSVLLTGGMAAVKGLKERLEKEFEVYLASSETSSEFQGKDMKFVKVPEYLLAYREKESEAGFLGGVVVAKVNFASPGGFVTKVCT